MTRYSPAAELPVAGPAEPLLRPPPKRSAELQEDFSNSAAGYMELRCQKGEEILRGALSESN